MAQASRLLRFRRWIGGFPIRADRIIVDARAYPQRFGFAQGAGQSAMGDAHILELVS